MRLHSLPFPKQKVPAIFADPNSMTIAAKQKLNRLCLAVVKEDDHAKFNALLEELNAFFEHKLPSTVLEHNACRKRALYVVCSRSAAFRSSIAEFKTLRNL